jgi:hypothetical protein
MRVIRPVSALPLNHAAEFMQILLASTGDLTDETRLSADAHFTFPGVAEPTYLLLDLTVDYDDNIRLVEANTSNAGGSSVAGRDLMRVGHEVGVMDSRGVVLTDDTIVLTPLSPDSRSSPEIMTRAAVRASLMTSHFGMPVRLTSVDRADLPTGVTAVYGGIPTMADDLSLDASGLRYRGRPVAFLNNPNVLVELARRMSVSAEHLIASLASHPAQPDPIHEGAKVALLGLDKLAQQEVVARAGSMRRVFAEPASLGAAHLADAAIAIARRYNGAIIKPMAASGGTGVIPVDPLVRAEDLIAEIEFAQDKLKAKYGAGWRSTCPMAVFEFIDIRPALTPTGPRRWDLRVQVLATPEETVITPLSARLCPSPIGPVLDRASTVNNLTGRTTREANRLAVADLLDLTGFGSQVLDRFAGAAFDFTRLVTLTTPASPPTAVAVPGVTSDA